MKSPGHFQADGLGQVGPGAVPDKLGLIGNVRLVQIVVVPQIFGHRPALCQAGKLRIIFSPHTHGRLRRLDGGAKGCLVSFQKMDMLVPAGLVAAHQDHHAAAKPEADNGKGYLQPFDKQFLLAEQEQQHPCSADEEDHPIPVELEIIAEGRGHPRTLKSKIAVGDQLHGVRQQGYVHVARIDPGIYRIVQQIIIEQLAVFIEPGFHAIAGIFALVHRIGKLHLADKLCLPQINVHHRLAHRLVCLAIDDRQRLIQGALVFRPQQFIIQPVHLVLIAQIFRRLLVQLRGKLFHLHVHPVVRAVQPVCLLVSAIFQTVLVEIKDLQKHHHDCRRQACKEGPASA